MRAFGPGCLLLKFILLPVVVNSAGVTLYDVSTTPAPSTRPVSVEIVESRTLSEFGPIESGTRYIEHATRYKYAIHEPSTTAVITDLVPYTQTIDNYASGYVQYGLIPARPNANGGTLYGQMHRSCGFDFQASSGDCVLIYQLPQPTEKPENIPAYFRGMSYTTTYTGVPYAWTTLATATAPAATNGASHPTSTTLMTALSVILAGFFLL